MTRSTSTDRFIVCLNDPGDPNLTDHCLDEMVRQKTHGIPVGCEDCSDHGMLRDDPVFKMVTGCTLAAAVLVNRSSTVRVDPEAMRESTC